MPKFVELPKLTPAETEVVKLIALGYGQHEIGLMLDCSWRTVDTHRTNIYRKMGFENAVDATHYALARGMVGNKFLVVRGDGAGEAAEETASEVKGEKTVIGVLGTSGNRNLFRRNDCVRRQNRQY